MRSACGARLAATGRCSTPPTRRRGSSRRSTVVSTAGTRPRRWRATTPRTSTGSDGSRDAGQASPYLSREEQMSQASALRTPDRAQQARERLRCRVRLPDGRTFAGELPPERHRRLQICLLHEHTNGLVELAAGTRGDGRLQITTRRRADHFLLGGGSGEEGWLGTLLELAARHAERG